MFFLLKNRRRAGLNRMGWDVLKLPAYSFQSNEIERVLSIFFADEYVGIYLVK
jgi:hypothetical protein